MNKILLFLDDYRIPLNCATYMHYKTDCKVYHEKWNIVRSYKQFVEFIEANGLPDIISFDHDLADVVELKEELDPNEWFNFSENREYTGLDCAKWLIDYCIKHKKDLPKYIVHSANPIGAKRISDLLNDFKKYESKFRNKS